MAIERFDITTLALRLVKTGLKCKQIPDEWSNLGNPTNHTSY